MPEEEWPQPKFRSNIGKSASSRVPRFGTWQQEDAAAPVQPEAQADVQRLSKTNSTAGRFHSLARRCPSSSQSSSEDVSASSMASMATAVAGSSGCVPQTRKRFTKEFENARQRKVGFENPPDSEAEDVAGRHCDGASTPQGHGEMNNEAASLRRDHSTQGILAAPDSSTAIFRCPSEPPAHWKAPTKKESSGGGGLLSLEAIRNLGMVIKEAGRTGSGLLRAKSPAPGGDALAGFLAAQEEAEKKLERTYSQFSEDIRTEERDSTAPKPALLFAGWDDDKTQEGLQLSPMSSYSSVFEEMREGRGKRAEKQLERLKLMYASEAHRGIASVKEEEEPAPPPPLLSTLLQARDRDPPPSSLPKLQAMEREGVSSPEGGPSCTTDTNSSSSGMGSAKWDGSPKSDEQPRLMGAHSEQLLGAHDLMGARDDVMGGHDELSEAAWLKQRMTKKAAGMGAPLDPAGCRDASENKLGSKTLDRERDSLEQARGSLAGRMERTYSESVVHSKPGKGRAKGGGADTAAASPAIPAKRSTPLSTRHQVMSTFPKRSASIGPAPSAAQAASSSNKADLRSSSSDKAQSHRGKDAAPRSKSMNARGKRQKNTDGEQPRLHNSPATATRDARTEQPKLPSLSPATRDARIALERKASASHSRSSSRSDPAAHAPDGRPPRAPQPRPAAKGAATPKEEAKGPQPRARPVGGATPKEEAKGAGTRSAPVGGAIPEEDVDSSTEASSVRCIRGKLKRYGSAPNAGAGSARSPQQASVGWHRHVHGFRMASSSSFRAWFRFDQDTKPPTGTA